MSSANERLSLWPIGSLPGQKSIRLAKKGGDFSLPKAGFRRYQPGDPFSPRLFAERKQDGHGKVTPALFVFGACSFARATKRPARTTN